MPTMYFEKDVNSKALDGKCIAVIGYGSQGRGQSLNLRDSGLNVILGLREGGKSWEAAKVDGWEPRTIEDAAKEADIVCMLTPDLSQPKAWTDQVQPNLKDGGTLLFAHGYVNFGDYLSILGPQLFFSRFPRVVTRKERVENIIYLCGICLPRIPPQKSAPKKRKSALYTTLKKSAPKPKIVFFSAFSAFSAKAYRGSAYIRHSLKNKTTYVLAFWARAEIASEKKAEKNDTVIRGSYLSGRQLAGTFVLPS